MGTISQIRIVLYVGKAIRRDDDKSDIKEPRSVPMKLPILQKFLRSKLVPDAGEISQILP